MKKYLLISSIAALALTSCSNNEYLGENPGGTHELEKGIVFTGTPGAFQKDLHTGADAAGMLGSRFVVGGYKGATSVATTTVFDNYNVIYEANTAGKTESNTADWEYVGKFVHKYAGDHGITAQTIKYWDYSQAQYDFIAYSTGVTDFAKIKYAVNPAADELYVSDITPLTATNAASGGAYMVQGTKDMLKNFYLADLVTVPQANYGNEVQLKFRNIASKVRLAFYETVPGYSVRDVEFYESNTAAIRYVPAVPQPTSGTMENYFQQDGTPYTSSDNYDSEKTYYVPESDVTTTATLYTSGTGLINNAGTYTVYYPTVNDGTPVSDKNKAHVAFTPDASGTSTTSAYDELDYVRDQASTLELSGKYLGTTSATATYATSSSTKPFFTVLPNEEATALTLRVNYTLVSNDGSKETIKVWGAKAVVPAEYCQWKSNYAYTYIFKISDNTNGSTEALGGVEGLRPITFDAVVVDDEDGMQESVTTVATPSITTYSPGVQPSANNEYLTGKDVYVMVSDKDNQGSVVNDLNVNAKLMVVTGTAEISEATVLDALNMGTTDGDVTTGRNGIVLTRVYPETTVTAIPGVNGNNITTVTVAGSETAIAASNVTKFTTGAAGTVYAYVYFFEAGTPSTYNTAVNVATEPTGWPTGYYTDFDCTVVAPATFAAGLYYQKLTNNNNKYAVKVIKVQE